MRLILGEHDITMRPGEVAEFDTRLPHWFGPAGDEPSRSSASTAATANGCTFARRPAGRVARRTDSFPDTKVAGVLAAQASGVLRGRFELRVADPLHKRTPEADHSLRPRGLRLAGGRTHWRRSC